MSLYSKLNQRPIGWHHWRFYTVSRPLIVIICYARQDGRWYSSRIASRIAGGGCGMAIKFSEKRKKETKGKDGYSRGKETVLRDFYDRVSSRWHDFIEISPQVFRLRKRSRITTQNLSGDAQLSTITRRASRDFNVTVKPNAIF